MRAGKLPPAMLTRAVLSRIGARRADVLVHARFGEDSAVVDFGNSVAVLSSDPITAASEGTGWLAVHVACNDVAANGAEPVGVLVTMLLPLSAEEQQAADLMAEVDRAARELGVEVLGGHTEVTPQLAQPLLVLTALGRAPRDGYLTSSGARVGDEVIVTKSAAVEGTAILATDFADRLVPALGEDLVRRAQAFREEISIVPEARVATRAGASALHDATEGGVLGAIYELAAASGKGVVVWPERIPVRPETAAICHHFGADPLRLISSGALVVAAPPERRVAAALARAGIPAAVVGEIASSGHCLQWADRVADLAPPESDELWRVIESTKLHA